MRIGNFATVSVFLFLLAGGCGRENTVQRRIAATFRDPGSVQFLDFHLRDGIACGRVNAKNAFGGYSGFRPFVASTGGDGELLPDFGPDEPFSNEDFLSALQTDRHACAFEKAHPGQGYSGCRLEPEDQRRRALTKSFEDTFRLCVGVSKP